MENKRPELNLENQPVISVVTELHSYFRDLQSFYKIAHGEVISQLEESNEENKIQELKAKLTEINQKIDLFHILNNAISIADTVLHTETMIDEFRSK